ncbi:MAG: hypothetical protein Tsb002_09650 [Wenzhouxiangellaceae bacterium]
MTAALLLLGGALAQAQAPVNGSFENGLTGWTVGGAGQVDSLTAAALNNRLPPTDGSRFAVLSNGPGNVLGPAAFIDGNGLTEFDISTLTTTLNFDFFPAVIRFDWTFPSGEEDQAFNFDDVFDVLVGGTRILSGSTNKPGGASNFPDVPAGVPPAIVIGGGGATDGTNLRFGVAGFSSLCVAVPGAAPASNSIPLQFRIADQNDRNFDSALVIDNVRVEPFCGAPGTIALRQVSNSVAGQAENKDGSIIVRLAQNRSPDISSDGSRMVLIANADYGGGNPFLLEQAFLYSGGAFQRLTNFTGDEVQAVDISEDGDWAVVAARASENDNLEIFTIQLPGGAVQQVTTTSGCDNTSPSINNNGRRIAFLTTCGSDIAAGFNADGNREMVVRNNAGFVTNETLSCQSFRPALSSQNSGRFTSFASTCNFTGANGDGNLEIFRFDRNGAGSFIQVTNTSAATAVLDPVSITEDGRYTTYLAQDSGGRHVVFRYDVNNGTSTFQGISRPDRLIFNVSMIETADGNDIFYEAIDLTAIPPTPASLFGHINATSQIVTEGVANNGSLGLAAARIGGVPHVYFSVGDDLVGQNSDGNPEIFEGRVE